MINRLNDTISANLDSYEDGKKNLKEIYDKIMTERLEVQKEGYELMLRGKEDDKMYLSMQINEGAD